MTILPIYVYIQVTTGTKLIFADISQIKSWGLESSLNVIKPHKHSKAILHCNAGVLEEIEGQLQGRDAKGFLESLFLEVDGWSHLCM